MQVGKDTRVDVLVLAHSSVALAADEASAKPTDLGLGTALYSVSQATDPATNIRIQDTAAWFDQLDGAVLRELAQQMLDRARDLGLYYE